MAEKIIEPGTKFGKLTTLARLETRHRGSVVYRCICECGGYKDVDAVSLRTGRITSCRCQKYYDWVGFTFSTFTVIEKKGSTPSRNTLWLCRCSCGYEETRSTKSFLHLKTSKNPAGVRCPNCEQVKYDELAAFNYVLTQYIYGARSRNLPFDLTEEQVKTIISSNCYYCDTEPILRKVGTRKFHDFVCNGIDRLDNTLGYTMENCVPCCSKCNYAKRDLSVKDFVDHCKKVALKCCVEAFG